MSTDPDSRTLIGGALRQAFEIRDDGLDSRLMTLMIELSREDIAQYRPPLTGVKKSCNRSANDQLHAPLQQEETMEADRRGNGGRTILIVVAVVLIVGVIAVATGFVNLSGDAGRLPEVSVNSGRAPSVDADVGSVDVGTSKADVTVPTVGTRQEQVDVPTVSVKPADGK